MVFCSKIYAITHLMDAQRITTVVSWTGQLDITIAEKTFTIYPGDSFRIRGEPFLYANPYQAPAIAIWVIAPPVY